MRRGFVVVSGVVLFAAWPQAYAAAQPATPEAAPTARPSGETLYEELSERARRGGDEATLFGALEAAAAGIDWSTARATSLSANIRRLETAAGAGRPAGTFYLVRELSGEVYVLVLPAERGALAPGADSPYAGLSDKVGQKVSCEAEVAAATVAGVEYRFLRLRSTPERLLLDRLFVVAIVVLLFLTMVGMGLTLTPKDFGLVFRKPAGMLVGIVCQFGLLPLAAMAVGRAAGYYDAYPFVFLGLILIAASPGGVTSNLMTYFGKGDVALSVSLTAVCTVLALFFTPFLLSVYGGNIPEFQVPVREVFQQMLVLVVVPLFVGMLVRWKAERFARRAEKVFAAIGLLALLFLIVVGILGNLEKFADTDRYGFKFYAVVFALTFLGMLVAGLLSRLARVSNFQTRAIALECGLRNASLAMTIALLLQDRMGDFYSSMFFTSGIFGLWMYVAGLLTILLFPKCLPVPKPAGPEAPTGGAGATPAAAG